MLRDFLLLILRIALRLARGALLSFASPNESKQRKGDPGRTPSLCAGSLRCSESRGSGRQDIPVLPPRLAASLPPTLRAIPRLSSAARRPLREWKSTAKAKGALRCARLRARSKAKYKVAGSPLSRGRQFFYGTFFGCRSGFSPTAEIDAYSLCRAKARPTFFRVVFDKFVTPA